MGDEAKLGTWPVSVEVPVAWGDMDAFGHVNNTVFLRWFETARIAYFQAIGVADKMEGERIGPILARTAIDFRLPVVFPDTITVSATVQRIGTTSFVMAYRVTSSAHEGAIAAEGEGVIVQLDYGSGAKVPLADALRERIEHLETGARPS